MSGENHELNMRIVIVATVILCMCVTCLVSVSQSTVEVAVFDWYSHLAYSELVVRGAVERVTVDDVTMSDILGPSAEHPERDTQRVQLIWTTLRVDEVMKGTCELAKLTVAAWLPYFLREGEEYVLCLRFNKNLKGGTFTFKGWENVFALPDGINTRRGGDEGAITVDEIRAELQSFGIESIAKQADLIATGTIVEMKPSEPNVPGKHAVLDCVLKVDSLMKGSLDAQTVTFKIITGGTYSPSWRTYMPHTIRVGEKWYVFLKKGEIEGGVAYYPFAGSNGFLKIEGERLIYNLRVDFPYTKHQVDEIVRRASSK